MSPELTNSNKDLPNSKMNKHSKVKSKHEDTLKSKGDTNSDKITSKEILQIRNNHVKRERKRSVLWISGNVTQLDPNDGLISQNELELRLIYCFLFITSLVCLTSVSILYIVESKIQANEKIQPVVYPFIQRDSGKKIKIN